MLVLARKEDAANNFARGHYTIGKEIMIGPNSEARRQLHWFAGVHGVQRSGRRHWFYVREHEPAHGASYFFAHGFSAV